MLRADECGLNCKKSMSPICSVGLRTKGELNGMSIVKCLPEVLILLLLR